MRRILRTLVLGAAMAAGTALLGWWTVPIVAAVGARVFPHAPVRTAVTAAMIAWAGLLGWSVWQAPAATLTHRVAGVFHLPPWGLVALTLLFPALLAGAAARITRTVPFR